MKYCISIFVALASVALSGCAQEKLEIKNPFPTRQELVQISAKSVELDAVEQPEVAQVETWELTGPLPDQIGYRAHTPADAVEEAFYNAIGSDTKTLQGSESMHCAAREVGHFVLEHDKLPYESLQQFIFARCGVMTTAHGVQYRTRPGATQADGIAQAEGAVESVRKHADQVQHTVDAGFWRGQKGDQVIFVTTTGRKIVELQPTPMEAAPGGKVVLQGRVLLPKMSYAYGLINQGDFGYERCKTDPSVPMPAFRIECAANTADELAYFQLAAKAKSSVMARSLLVQLVWPGGELSKVYRSPATRRALVKAQREQRAAASRAEAQQEGGKPAAGSELEGGEQDGSEQDGSEQEGGEQAEQAQAVEPVPLVASSGGASGDFPDYFVTLLNKVREEANMNPVDHAAKQSASIQSVTKQYIAANREDDEATANKLIMGVMAGWDVDGPVVDAGISSSWIMSRDPVQLLESMLETPGGRQTLMDPMASQVALGIHDHETSMSSIVASYAFVPDEHPNRRTKRVLDALEEQREAFGSRAPKEDSRLRSVSRKLAEKIEKGDVGVVEARDLLMDRVSQRYRKPVYGSAFVTHSLDEIDFPKQLLTPKNLPVSIIVAPFTKKGFPWTMYAVVIVFPQQPKANIAGL
ncbi:hypothetical protein FIV42_19635 [Persicimonas caeni]|uniref:CAP domain-containing protein n=1 Tax=Persicimonas caeni TaxID=2292766 RepID=A0A4Y6PX88_PERCE|nr:hypothetical protein [Persicimonas caeni]QDG52873.1 hypothetical protein FIV42_19635 [Persicimonas caeni]QED34095.1 hypothetical protein FRD00_19630 [Persicimonas caeni]